MPIQQLLEAIAERVSASASVKNVYGDPIVMGDRTVVPVAQVRYGFGGGGGSRPKVEDTSSGGAGAGGRVSVRPCGALEITPQSTRLIEFGKTRSIGAAVALGFLLGAAVVALSGARRIEVVKRRA